MNDARFFAGLVPELIPLAKSHREHCAQAGLTLVFIVGLRTWAEQMDAYAKGRVRTATGWELVNHAAMVTRALPDQSPHCRGAAYDCAPLDQHETIDWNRADLFEAVAKLAPVGLVWGGTFTFRDCDHFELPNWKAYPVNGPAQQSLI